MSLGSRIGEWRDALQDIELDQLDFENVGGWPQPIKVIAMVIVFAVTLAAGYFFLIKPELQDLEAKEKHEQTLRTEFETKAFEVYNLDALRADMAKMNETFDALVGQLPSDTEVPGLLEDITATGVSNGLEFQRIDLQDEVVQEFYIELPIEIEVTGSYHDLGAFVSGISGLPRIVTLHNFEIEPEEGRPGVMRMNILARTYRYKSGDEE